MGDRSTFVSEDFAYDFPPWFVEKHRHYLHFGAGARSEEPYIGLPISSRYEVKLYSGKAIDLFEDVSKCLRDSGSQLSIRMAVINEAWPMMQEVIISANDVLIQTVEGEE